MKKETLILMTLILGVSFKSFAGTGNAKDEFIFILSIIGFLLIVFVLLSGIEYTRKNGKTMIIRSMSFVKNKIAFLREYLNKISSNNSNLVYPNSMVSKELDNKSTTSILL